MKRSDSAAAFLFSPLVLARGPGSQDSSLTAADFAGIPPTAATLGDSVKPGALNAARMCSTRSLRRKSAAAAPALLRFVPACLQRLRGSLFAGGCLLILTTSLMGCGGGGSNSSISNPGGSQSTSPATFAATFGKVDSSLTPSGELTGDFTGSGQMNLIVYGQISGSTGLGIQAFVSNGAGKYSGLAVQTLNFTAVPKAGMTFANFSPLAMDVNGDGKLDILDGISAAYGNGDGTFQQPVTLQFLASGSIGTWASDVNADGKIDIIAVDNPGDLTQSSQPAFQITVFQNQGSGSFSSLGTFTVAQSPGPVLFAQLDSLAFADLNGDGKPDMFVQANFVPAGNAPGPPQMFIVMNNGDGTFGAPQSYSDPATSGNLSELPVALADFNGDGKIDLAVAFNDGTGRAILDVAAGHGDGTFGSGQMIDLDPTPGVALTQIGSIVASDLNEDGKLDVALGDGLWAQGNGDGTFQIPSTPLFPSVISNAQIQSFPVVPFVFPGSSTPALVYLNLTSGSPAVITPGH